MDTLYLSPLPIRKGKPIFFRVIYGVIFQQIVGNNLNHISHENIKRKSNRDPVWLVEAPKKLTTSQDEVQVKVTGRIGKYNLVSLILYIDINGVRYRDPEIVLGHDTSKREFIPYHYMNDFFRIEECYAQLTPDGLVLEDEFGQYNLTNLANRLLLQIASK